MKIDFDKIIQNYNNEIKILETWQLESCKKNIDNKGYIPEEVIVAISLRMQELRNEISKIQHWSIMSL